MQLDLSKYPLAALDSRSRWSVFALVASIAAIGWIYLIYMVWVMENMHLVDMWMPPHVAVRVWTAYDFLMLIVMWMLMMAAMMLPSTLPMVWIHNTMSQNRKKKRHSSVPTFIFVMGYVATWSLYSIVATLLQWQFHKKGLMDPMMDSNSYLLSGSILLIAGLYQWTPLKEACLNKCRNPVGFLISNWRDTYRGTFNMGLSHGLYCVGCCWALMAILFAVGVMNMLWIVILSVFAIVEKTLLPPAVGKYLIGSLLIVWGGWWLYLWI